MKDILSVWGRFLGRNYTAVSTNNNYAEQRENVFVEEGKRKRKSVVGKLFRGKHKSYITLAVLGVICIISGIFIVVVDPYEMVFRWKIFFTNGGEIFEMWRKPPVDLYLRVFLFNVTNKDAFLKGEEKLKVQEVGPYVYRLILFNSITRHHWQYQQNIESIKELQNLKQFYLSFDD